VVRSLTLAAMQVVRLHPESCGVFARGGTHEGVIAGGCSYVEGVVGNVMWREPVACGSHYENSESVDRGTVEAMIDRTSKCIREFVE
jgi:hypothetical protein